METCFRCGVSSDKAILYDAISKDGIVKICGKCNIEENLPIIRKSAPNKNSNSNPEQEKRLTVRERLSYMAGFKPQEEKTKGEEPGKKTEEAKKQDEELKKIIAKKYEEELKSGGANIKIDALGNEGMKRNFHWIIMRARRARHLTQREFAESIGEPEIAIKLAEQGMLPREHESLVKKIQNTLNIQITEIPYDTYTKLPPQEIQNPEEPIPENYNEDFELDSGKEKRWTIGDLLRIKRRVRVKERDRKINISDALNGEEFGDSKKGETEGEKDN